MKGNLPRLSSLFPVNAPKSAYRWIRQCYPSLSTAISSFSPASLASAPDPTTDRFIGRRQFASQAARTPNAQEVYDVFIVGGGVSGTALLYTLSSFTDLKKLCLCERRGDVALVASAPNNNSQTIHCGDIETNYTLQKAATVKRQADMLRNYATKLPAATAEKCISKYSKIALGVGDEECHTIEKRFEELKNLFPNMQLLGKQQLAEVEPRIAMQNSHSLRPENINGIYVDNEYTAVNYYELSKSFVSLAKASEKKVDVYMNTEVKSIHQEADDLFSIATKGHIYKARFVVVSSCGHSLQIAHRMGYGLQYSCFPVAGSFYFTPQLLNGKVYTVQDPKLPFAAVHGDPDVTTPDKTRFGPTALPLPMLERYNYATVKDFLEVLKVDKSLIAALWKLFKDSKTRNYVLRNFLFEVPVLNTKIFLKDVQKIVPSMKATDLTYAKGFGGVRPQLIDKVAKKLTLGEAKINPGTGIIFNITPSPGGTTCLGTSEEDMKTICKRLGATVNEKLYREMILEGAYPVV